MVVKEVKLRIDRFRFTEKSTIGKFYINDKFFCYTLEDKVRPLGEKVHGKTAICHGVFSVTIGWSNRFKQLMPYVYNQKDYNLIDDGHGVQFRGVRIHWGNYPKDTEGCILVGFTESKDFVGNSRKAYSELMTILEDIDIAKLEIFNL
jgi:hypothetical protein